MKHRYKGLEKIGLYLYYLLKTLIAMGAIFSVIQGDWNNAILITIVFFSTYIPGVLKKKYRFYLPIEFDLFIISFIFLALFLGEIHSYYYKFWWWDIWLHTESGFLLGMLGFLLVYILNTQENIKMHMKPGFISIFAFTFAMTIGVIWEIFEFLSDSSLGTNMQKSGLQDTMWDLIVVAIGGLIISIIGYFWMKNKIRFFVFDRSIKKFINKNQHLFEDKK